MTVKLPEKVKLLINILKRNGFAAHAVGGCIRDSLLGIEPHDWDICTSATPDQMKRCFEGLHTIETGIRHGTLTVMAGNEPFEVTTYRIDGDYLDNRHPEEVIFVGSLSEDLSRRDFTINAMAFSDETGLADPFGGEADLESKLIRCVGSPEKRFHEDALRIIRALRFASVFQFSIEPLTADSIHKNKDLLNNIAAERINPEFGKLICGRGAGAVLHEYADVLEVIIPEIAAMIGFRQDIPYNCYDVWEQTVKSIAHAANDLIVRLAMLMHGIVKPVCFTKGEDGIGYFYGHPVRSAEMAYGIMKRLRFDNISTEKVKELILYHDADIKPNAVCVKKLLNKIGPDNLRLLLLVKLADCSAQNPEYSSLKEQELNEFRKLMLKVLEERQCFSLKDLAVTGRDLIGIGIPQGARIGDILKALLDMVVNEEIENEREILINAAKHMIGKP